MTARYPDTLQAMDFCFQQTCMDTQELQQVMMALCASHHRIKYITHSLLNLTQQREALKLALVPTHTLPSSLPLQHYPLSINGCLSEYLLDDNNESIPDGVNVGMFWEHFNTLKHKKPLHWLVGADHPWHLGC